MSLGWDAGIERVTVTVRIREWFRSGLVALPDCFRREIGKTRKQGEAWARLRRNWLVCFLDRAERRSRLFPTYGSDSRARDGAILGIRDGPDGTLNKWIQAWFRINAPTWIGDAECQMTTPTAVCARLGSTCRIGRISTYRNPFRRHDIPRENSHLRCSHERPSARSYWSTSPCRNSWEPFPHKQFPTPPAAAVRSNSIHSHKHTHTNTPSRSEAKTHHKPFQSKKKI